MKDDSVLQTCELLLTELDHSGYPINAAIHKTVYPVAVVSENGKPVIEFASDVISGEASIELAEHLYNGTEKSPLEFNVYHDPNVVKLGEELLVKINTGPS